MWEKAAERMCHPPILREEMLGELKSVDVMWREKAGELKLSRLKR